MESKAKEYCIKRYKAVIEAVKNENLEPLKELGKQYAHKVPSDLVVLISAHKMCLAIVSMPEELKKMSRKWLDEHGYSYEI